jgi:hypothetical protein
MVMPEAHAEPELIHTFQDALHTGDGRAYEVRVYGRARADGTCIAWLEFADPSGRILRTPRETTQSSLEQVKYWADGLEHVYLEGALGRAQAI